MLLPSLEKRGREGTFVKSVRTNDQRQTPKRKEVKPFTFKLKKLRMRRDKKRCR